MQIKEHLEAWGDDALRELCDIRPDGTDEYSRQCDFAGCYPWLDEVMRLPPHDTVIHSVMDDGKAFK